MQRTSSVTRSTPIADKSSILRALLLISLTTAFVACADLPRDQHGSTDRIRESGELVVGISHEGFDSVATEEREKMLVEKVAARFGARVLWRRGNAHQLLEDLEEMRLPLVSATIPCDSPFAGRVGLSMPYMENGLHGKDYCLAVAPGENRLLLLVDEVIAEARHGEQR